MITFEDQLKQSINKLEVFIKENTKGFISFDFLSFNNGIITINVYRYLKSGKAKFEQQKYSFDFANNLSSEV